MQRLVREHCQNAKVVHFGAAYIDPRHLVFVVLTQTDDERDRLRNDTSLEPRLRATLIPNGYPEDAVSMVNFDLIQKRPSSEILVEIGIAP